MLQSGRARVKMHGKDIDSSEAVLASMKEQVLAGSTEYGPQWLLDFRDQQRRGQSGPP